MHDSHDSFRPCVMPSDSVFVFLKTTLYVGRYAGIERAVLALKHIDEIHVTRIALRRARLRISLPPRPSSLLARSSLGTRDFLKRHFVVKKIYVLPDLDSNQDDDFQRVASYH